MCCPVLIRLIKKYHHQTIGYLPSSISSTANKCKSELWKTVRLTSFPYPQYCIPFQSSSSCPSIPSFVFSSITLGGWENMNSKCLWKIDDVKRRVGWLVCDNKKGDTCGWVSYCFTGVFECDSGCGKVNAMSVLVEESEIVSTSVKLSCICSFWERLLGGTYIRCIRTG